MSLEAYLKTAQASETPQRAEERALRLASRKLREASERNARGAELVEALHFNRELWRVFSDDCALPGNRLPAETRAAIVSLGLWVSRFSSEVAAGRDGVEALVEVNQQMIEGLAGQSSAPG